MKRIFSLCALLTIFSIGALADIPRPKTPTPTPTPKQKKSFESNFYISIEKDAKEARLVIPKSMVSQLRAELDELDGGANNAAFLTFSRTQTIVSGLFLSLAVIFGGVWLTRSRGKNGLKPNKTLIAGAVLFLFGAFATLVYANVGPPPEARSITGKLFTPAVHQYKQAWGAVRVETTDQGSGIQLIVPDVPGEKKTEE